MYPSFFDELTKIADEKSLKTRAIESAVTARPWVQRFVTGAIPTAVAANFLLPIKDPHLKSKIIAGAGLAGGGAGVADLALKRWAKKHPRRVAAKALKKQASIRKIAAMATDLRMTGIGGVKRPPFPTEDSKQQAFQQFQNSQKPGRFTTHTQAKHLRGPGASISQIAPLPR